MGSIHSTEREFKEKLKVLLVSLYVHKLMPFIPIQAIWPYSGHYCPTMKNFREFIAFLIEHDVDLTNVKVSEPLQAIFLCRLVTYPLSE